MRTVAKYVVLLMASLIVLSCSVDGEDGTSYIAYSWYCIQGVYTEDPAFGNTIYNGEYETATEGEYYMDYQDCNGDVWWAVYEIEIDEGEEGGLFTRGEDGDDLYFELYLSSSGPSFYTSSSTAGTGASGLGVDGLLDVASDDEDLRIHESGADVAAELEQDESSRFDVDTSAAETHVYHGEDYTVTIRGGRIE
jgi:hypothetical protein